MPLEELQSQVKRLIGDIISKPKMSDKLLTKPPFRFLHDIVTNVMGKTNFAQGLYTEDEMVSSNVTDKQAKMDFLDKLILCVGICQGEAVNVRSIKIVAGLEAECTNALLIALAKSASDENLDTTEAAAMTLRGASPAPHSIPKQSMGAGGGGRSSASSQEIAETTRENITVEEHFGRGESKHDFKDTGNESKDNTEDITAPSSINTSPNRNIPPRSQSRAGRNPQPSNDPAINGSLMTSSTAPQLPPGIDRDIEACSTDWERTKELLDGLIAKPRASEKLLSRPPFRFLHDLIMAVIRNTGFAEGLFDERESDSSAITDKDSKIAYLEKIMKMVGMSLNTIVDCRASKVVAGLEAENTNRFLQLFILAATKCQDASAFTVHSINHPDIPFHGTSNSISGSGGDAMLENNSSEGRTESKNDVDTIENFGGSGRRSSRNSMNESKSEEDSKEKDRGDFGDASHLRGQQQKQQQQEVMGKDNDKNNMNMNSGGEKRSLRPRTAKKRPPIVKENVEEVDAKTEAAKFAQSSAQKSNIMIMREGVADEEESEEEDEGPEPQEEDRLGGNGNNIDKDDKKNHGKLVQDIMNQQKKDEAKKKEEEDNGGADGLDTSKSRKSSTASTEGGIRMGRLSLTGNTKSFVGKSGGMNGPALGPVEIEELRNMVQSVSKAAHPLGRCMEGFQEDISIMSKEFESWSNEYRNKMESLEEAKRITEIELQPLRLSLIEVEEQLKEQSAKVNGMKCAIAKNDDRISQFLHMVVQGGNGNTESANNFTSLK